MLDPVNSLKSGFLPNFICSLIMVKNISQPQFWRFCTCRYYDIIIIKLIIMFIENISSFFIIDSPLIWTWSHQIINSSLSSMHNLRIFYWARKSWKQIYHQRSFKYRRISHGWQNCPRNESLQVIFIEIDALFLPSKYLT